MLESQRKYRNESRLKEMHPAFRVRVEGVLKELEGYGLRPRIQEAWRSERDQLKAYNRGSTKVKYSFHNVTAPDGTKEALAADIYDDNRPIGPKLDYILHLAAAAKNNGLASGAQWDLDEEKLAALDVALANKDWNAKVHIGWDPLHVEITGISIEEVKEGKRPEISTSEPAPTEPPTEIPASNNKEIPPAEEGRREIKPRRYKVEDLETNQVIEYQWNTAFKPVVLLPVPYVSQIGSSADTHRNDCGAACAVMMLQAYFDIRMTPDEFYTKFAIQGDPFLSVTQMRNAMGSLGLLTDFRAGLAIHDLFNFISASRPVIVLLRYTVLHDAGLTEKTFDDPHFAVMVGIDCRNIYLHDPLYTDPANGDAHPYPLDIFWKAWKAVAQDNRYPNPERGAIIPTAGIGFRLTRKVRITIPSLNVRSGPGLNNPIVAKLRKGDIVEVVREFNGWGETNPERWIYLAYTAAVQ